MDGGLKLLPAADVMQMVLAGVHRLGRLRRVESVVGVVMDDRGVAFVDCDHGGGVTARVDMVWVELGGRGYWVGCCEVCEGLLISAMVGEGGGE